MLLMHTLLLPKVGGGWAVVNLTWFVALEDVPEDEASRLILYTGGDSVEVIPVAMTAQEFYAKYVTKEDAPS